MDIWILERFRIIRGKYIFDMLENLIARNRQPQWIWTRCLKGGTTSLIISVTRKNDRMYYDRMYYYCETHGDIIMV